MLCKIGEIEVWRILEINGPFLPPETLFPNAGPDVGAVIEAHAPGQICQASGKMILPVQGFLLKTPSHIVLVDRHRSRQELHITRLNSRRVQQIIHKR